MKTEYGVADQILSHCHVIYVFVFPTSLQVLCERGAWQGLVREATTELNNQQLEASEARKKDEIKKRREGSDQTEQSQSPFLCNVHLWDRTRQA